MKKAIASTICTVLLLIGMFSTAALAQEETWVINNFESEQVGTQGWSKLWGESLQNVYWVDDVTGESLGALELYFDFVGGGGANGAFGKEEVDIMWTDTDTGATAISWDVFLPQEYEGSWFQVFVQDRGSWGWYSNGYTAGSDVPVEEWVTLTFDLKTLFAENPSIDPTLNIKTGIEFTGSTYDGPIWIDNVTLYNVSKPAGDLASPVISSVEVETDTLLSGRIRNAAVIRWQDNPVNLGETYNVYCSESPITDVTADGVIKVDHNLGRGVNYFAHYVYDNKSSEKTLYYALTSSAVVDGILVETEVTPASSTEAITLPTIMPIGIPFVENFEFTADGRLDEFYEYFEDGGISPESCSYDDWDPADKDLNFEAYYVFDSENLYIGVEVTDDDPYQGAQAWEGDGVDIFMGLYDVSALKELHAVGSLYGSTTADYRMSFAPNADPGSQFQKNGYEAWTLAGMEFSIEQTSAVYMIDAKIPLSALKAPEGDLFVPEEGMYIPFKMDINDNDGEDDPLYTGSLRTMILQHGSSDNDQNWLRPSAWSWAYIGNPATAVEDEVVVPMTSALHGNYPNPFNPSTTINYTLGNTAQVKLQVYDVLGRQVAELVNATQAAGDYQVTWNAMSNLGVKVGSGIYIVKMTAGNYQQTHKMILVK